MTSGKSDFVITLILPNKGKSGAVAQRTGSRLVPTATSFLLTQSLGVRVRRTAPECRLISW
jgi:hypothetical protein